MRGKWGYTWGTIRGMLWGPSSPPPITHGSAVLPYKEPMDQPPWL